MTDALTAAKYLLTLVDEEEGDLISNLKLQKLLYYAQGIHLALKDCPLFPERIEAWQHGPVVPLVYHVFKEKGSGPIERPLDFDFSKVSPEERESLDEANRVFGQYSAWRLAEMTHSEPPWATTTQGSAISQEAMKAYFKTLLVS